MNRDNIIIIFLIHPCKRKTASQHVELSCLKRVILWCRVVLYPVTANPPPTPPQPNPLPYTASFLYLIRRNGTLIIEIRNILLLTFSLSLSLSLE